MACDIRICSENAVFGQPEVGLGITPGFGGTQRLARTVGVGMAKQLIYTARNIKAPEALRIGLVNAVYPIEELMPAAKKMASIIAANAPIAVRNCKKPSTRACKQILQALLKLKKNFSAIALKQKIKNTAWRFSLIETRKRLRSLLSINNYSGGI